VQSPDPRLGQMATGDHVRVARLCVTSVRKEDSQGAKKQKGGAASGTIVAATEQLATSAVQGQAAAASKACRPAPARGRATRRVQQQQEQHELLGAASGCKSNAPRPAGLLCQQAGTPECRVKPLLWRPNAPLGRAQLLQASVASQPQQSRIASSSISNSVCCSKHRLQEQGPSAPMHNRAVAVLRQHSCCNNSTGRALSNSLSGAVRQQQLLQPHQQEAAPATLAQERLRQQQLPCKTTEERLPNKQLEQSVFVTTTASPTAHERLRRTLEQERIAVSNSGFSNSSRRGLRQHHSNRKLASAANTAASTPQTSSPHNTPQTSTSPQLDIPSALQAPAARETPSSATRTGTCARSRFFNNNRREVCGQAALSRRRLRSRSSSRRLHRRLHNRSDFQRRKLDSAATAATQPERTPPHQLEQERLRPQQFLQQQQQESLRQHSLSTNDCVRSRSTAADNRQTPQTASTPQTPQTHRHLT